jgi:hypothetical protein
LTDPHNDRLYGDRGIGCCHQALRQQGCLALWSAEANSGCCGATFAFVVTRYPPLREANPNRALSGSRQRAMCVYPKAGSIWDAVSHRKTAAVGHVGLIRWQIVKALDYCITYHLAYSQAPISWELSLKVPL